MPTVELSNGDELENAVELFREGNTVLRKDFQEALPGQSINAICGGDPGLMSGEELATAKAVLAEKVRVIKDGEKFYLVAKATLEFAKETFGIDWSADFDIMTLP